METETVHAAATADEVATEPTTGQFFVVVYQAAMVENRD